MNSVALSVSLDGLPQGEPPEGFFLPGPILIGRVTVLTSSDSPIHLQSLGLVLRGVSAAYIYPRRRFHRQRRTVSSVQELLNQTVIINVDKGSTSCMLEAGERTFPFRFEVDREGLPSSFVLPNVTSSVQYSIEAILTADGCQASVRTTFPFQGTIRVDEYKLREAITLRSTTSACCLCCSSKPVQIIATIPHKAFCPGEVIPLQVHVHNESDSLLELKAMLVQKYRLKIMRSFWRNYTAEIVCGCHYSTHHFLGGAQFDGGVLQPHSSVDWTSNEVTIHRRQPTTLSTNVINEYFLYVFISGPGKCRDYPSVSFPVIVGSSRACS